MRKTYFKLFHLFSSDAQISDHVRQWLRLPTFDARPWEDDELLLLLQTMYLDHDLCSKFAIDITTLRNFLYETYKNYNDVPFHNFRHCFCVAQMVSTLCVFVENVITYSITFVWTFNQKTVPFLISIKIRSLLIEESFMNEIEHMNI